MGIAGRRWYLPINGTRSSSAVRQPAYFAFMLPLCQQLLEVSRCQSSPTPAAGEAKLPASWLCPRCGSEMVLVERLSAQEIPWIFAKESHFVDTS